MVLRSLTPASDFSDISLHAAAHSGGTPDTLPSLMDLGSHIVYFMSFSFLFGVLFTVVVLMILDGIRINAEAEHNEASEEAPTGVVLDHALNDSPYHADMEKASTTQGFSLLEMAIVLSIIGLLVGGVLAAQSLMRSAELRSIVENEQRILAAVNAFQDKYDALPGDMFNATHIWGVQDANPATCKVTASTGTATCNGDGDGRVEWEDDNPPSVGANELFRFWQHLANAGLIEGMYTGVSGPGSNGDAIIGSNVPSAVISHIGYFVASGAVNPAEFFTLSYGNAIFVGGDYPDWQTSKEFLTSVEALTLDQKFDDGKPGQGKIIAYPYLAPCTDATDTNDLTAEYIPNASDTIACSLVFPQAF
jgi:prepilin-type N-terminal cleavage/methylation domain-containing protein